MSGSRASSGVSLIEALVAIVVLGILVGAVVPAFVSNLRLNSETEKRSQAVVAAQTVLDSLRADGSWPAYGLDPDGNPSVTPVLQVESGGRTFDVAVDYGPYCERGVCYSTARNLELEVRLDDTVYYQVATVYTNLQ